MLIEDYHIGKKVFEDLIGQIFVASTTDLDKAVYFKILHSHLSHDVELVRAFHRGAELACSLENEDHIRTVSHGHENNKHYAILENFNLTPLNIFLKQKKVFSLIEATEMVEKLAGIIRRLHIEDETYGILTPQNIFVDYDLHQIKIANFGFKEFIHRLIHTKDASVAPYIPYYSPEFINSDKIERQSDIFSLGVLFYRLLVGHPPWTSDNYDDYFVELRQRSVIPPSLQRLEIPDFLDGLVLDAIEPDMTKRCPNLSTFIQEVEKAKSSILASFTPTSQILSATNEERRFSDRDDGSEDDTLSEMASSSEEDTDTRDEEMIRDDPSDTPDRDNVSVKENESSQEETVRPNLPGAFTDKEYETSGEVETSVEDLKENGSAPAAAEENGQPSLIVTDDETEAVNGIQKERSIVSIQEQEIDDKPTLRLEPSTNGKEEEQEGVQKVPEKKTVEAPERVPEKAPKRAPQPQAGGRQRAQKAPSLPESPPVRSLPADIDEAEEYFHETATQTQTVSTRTVDLNRKQLDTRSFLSIMKIILLALIPVLAIYTLVAFTFDLNFSKRITSMLGANSKQSASARQRSGTAFNQANPLTGQNVKEQPIRTREMTTGESNRNGRTAKANETIDRGNREKNSASLTNRQSQDLTESGRGQPSERQSVNRSVQPRLEIWVRSGPTPLVADIFLNGEFYDRTDDEGRLVISGLRPASYVVKVSRVGFEMWAKEIQYQGGRQQVDVKLQPTSPVSP